MDSPTIRRETMARLADTPVQVFDLEIIRIGEVFDPLAHRPLLEAGQSLNARAVLVAADDTDEHRLAHHFAQLCELMQAYGITADLEFMPWTGVKHAQAAMRVIGLAGHPPNAGILVDALHFGRSNTTLSDITAIPKPCLHYAQICDATAGMHFSTEELIHTARQERLLPGEGSIDLQGLFAALPQDIPVSIEIPNLARSQMLGDKAWSALALKATRQVLGDVDA
jgi:sugar phosphate isomerase/epimerase